MPICWSPFVEIERLQRQLDERVRATSATDRMRLHWQLVQDARCLVWAQADRAGPMSEIDRAHFLLRRLYPDLEGPRLEQIIRYLEAEWAAGTWSGFRRPGPRELGA